jgi:hypothetical protein
MNPPKCNALDYIHFVIATQKGFTCAEAVRCQPEGKASAHDAFTRLLPRQSPDTEALWQEAKEVVDRALIPCDFRVYAKAQDGKSRNDYFQALLKKA